MTLHDSLARIPAPATAPAPAPHDPSAAGGDAFGVTPEPPAATAPSCLFDSAGWLAMWHTIPVEQRLRQAYVLARPDGPTPLGAAAPSGGTAPSALPLYEVTLSPFWHGYEVQTELVGRFGSPIVFAGSTYSMYTKRGHVPAALVRGAYRTAMTWIEDGPAETLVVPNLTAEGVAAWTAVAGPPLGTVLLERTFSYELTGDFSEHLFRTTTPKIRRDVERRLRRSHERGLRVTLVEGEEAHALVPQAYPLTVDTSDKNDWPALFDEESLHRLLDVPGSMLAAARVGDRLMGAFFGFRHGDEVTFLCGGVEYAGLRDLSTYVALMYRCTEWAYDHGLRRIEWGRDNYRFKERHGLTGTDLWALVYAPRPPEGLDAGLGRMHEVLSAYIRGT